MRQAIFLIALCLGAGSPGTTGAASAVFAGDPVDGSGAPYEILPGFPLVQAGPDGRLGTADDIVDASRIGDIDLVVRSGSPPATATLPAPTAAGARPVGVAGPVSAGGSPIAFTAFLSNGATGATAPAGQLLAAADMNGLPVVVAAFPDLDGDGVIGPSALDGPGDDHLELRELEPVGRGLALFAGGVARGQIAVRAGLPPSQGGLTVLLAGMALTGPFDAGFFEGAVPTGPAIATALPFLPERDLGRLIRDRASAAGPDRTLQQVIRFAAAPDSPAFTLSLDGSVPSVDAAVVHSQPATRTSLRPDIGQAIAAGATTDVVLASHGRNAKRRLRLFATDRWGNPADPPPGFVVTLHASAPSDIRIRPGRATIDGVSPTAAGLRVSVSARSGTADGSAHTVTIERDGAVVDRLACTVDARLNARPDLTVPTDATPTLQAAIASATDRNLDGTITIAVKPGRYRETLTITRALTLRGEDAATTVLQGDGTAPVVRVTAANVTLRGLGAVGGGSGFALEADSALVADSRAWRNQGAGVLVSGPGAQILRSAAVENGGDGVLVGATTGAVCADSALVGNGGAGVSLVSAQGARVEASTLADNVEDGVLLTETTDALVLGNRSTMNLGAGIALDGAVGGQIAGNLCATNHDDGLKTDQTVATLVSGNTLTANGKYGMFVRRSTGDDFAAAAGVQAPIGDNVAADNADGPLFVRPD